MPTVHIGFTAHLPSPRPDRLGQMDTLIQYSIDDGPSENIVLPSENPTDDQVQQAIRDQIAAAKKLRGTTFTVD